MDRKKVALKNSSLGFFLKILNMGIVYLTIPFLLKFLGKESYGVWVTIFSIISIVFFLDGGIINGLKTNLTREISFKNIKRAKELISNAYIVIGGVSLFFFVIGYILIDLLDFKELLNVTTVSEQELKEVFFVCLVFISFNFILSIYKSLFYSIQKVAFVEFSIFIYQVIIFSSIFYLYTNYQGSLIKISILYGSASFLVGVLFTVVFFFKRPELFPSAYLFSKKTLKDLFNISIGFFIIQLSMIIIFTSDNILISSLLSPEYVSKYDIVFKLFQIVITLTLLLIEPFWPLFTDAYEKKDLDWIYKVFKVYNKLFFVFVVLLVIFSFLINPIISFWVGEEFKADNGLIVSFFILVLIRVFPLIYMYFLNGIGRIKSQVVLYLIGAIINIPFSILFVKYYKLGLKGIVIGTILSIIAISFFIPLKSYKILKNS